MTISQNSLMKHIAYDKETGIFTRLITTNWRSKAGEVCGSIGDKGYIVIRVCGHIYRAHRLAWLYVYGRFPTKSIDHINGVKGDNRISNLREANHSENARNSSLRSDNTSGCTGVSWVREKGKWIAQCVLNKRNYRLGYFLDLQDAINARTEFARAAHGEFFRDNTTIFTHRGAKTKRTTP